MLKYLEQNPGPRDDGGGTREERLIKIHFKGSFGLAEVKVIILHSPKARIGDVFSYFVLARTWIFFFCNYRGIQPNHVE